VVALGADSLNRSFAGPGTIKRGQDPRRACRGEAKKEGQNRRKRKREKTHSVRPAGGKLTEMGGIYPTRDCKVDPRCRKRKNNYSQKGGGKRERRTEGILNQIHVYSARIKNVDWLQKRKEKGRKIGKESHSTTGEPAGTPCIAEEGK